jgi:hypothetical protein
VALVGGLDLEHPEGDRPLLQEALLGLCEDAALQTGHVDLLPPGLRFAVKAELRQGGAFEGAVPVLLRLGGFFQGLAFYDQVFKRDAVKMQAALGTQKMGA